MLKTSVLTSGSKGNCILVCSESTKILVDAGITYKKLAEFIDFFRINPEEINAIFISHEHHDHVNGAGVLCRKTKAPIHISRKTFSCCEHKLGKLPVNPTFFEVGNSIKIGDLVIKTFTSSHDAVDSCNFLIHHEDDETRKLAIATDLGYPPQILINHLKQATTVILESNHDVKMLMDGPYEWHLKQRIRSNNGHLSNEQAVSVITQILGDKLEKLILAHLSETNNTPEIAFKTMKGYLESVRADIKLIMSSQYECTPLIPV